MLATCDLSAFREILENTLRKVLNDDGVTDNLEGGLQMWTDPDMQARLQVIFGPSTNAFIALCTVLSERVNCITRELDQVRSILKAITCPDSL
jgi:hypothetical protein